MPALLGALADFFEKILVSKWMRLVVVRFLRGKRVAAMARGARRWRNYFLATSMALGSFAKVGAGARLAFHARGGLADSRRRATARLWRRASRGSAAAIAFQPLKSAARFGTMLSRKLSGGSVITRGA